MKFRIINSLLIAFACLAAFGCAPLDRPEKPLIYGYPQAEYHKAGSILMYTPGAELLTESSIRMQDYMRNILTSTRTQTTTPITSSPSMRVT